MLEDYDNIQYVPLACTMTQKNDKSRVFGLLAWSTVAYERFVTFLYRIKTTTSV